MEKERVLFWTGNIMRDSSENESVQLTQNFISKLKDILCKNFILFPQTVNCTVLDNKLFRIPLAAAATACSIAASSASPPICGI